jgi:hypothetical protein
MLPFRRVSHSWQYMKYGIVVRLNVARRATLQVMLAFAALAFVLALVTYFIPVLVVCFIYHTPGIMAALAVPQQALWHQSRARLHHKHMCGLLT